MNEKREFRLSIINNLDVLGLGDMIMKGNYLYTVETNSVKGELYILERKVKTSLNSYLLISLKRHL